MQNKLIQTTVKTIILLVILSAIYLVYSRQSLAKEQKIATRLANLIQNKIAYTSLTKLDYNEENFDLNKSNLVSIVLETNNKGLESPINDKEDQIFKTQKQILDSVFATSSFEDGVNILKAKQSVDNFNLQTQLIQELQQDLDRLRMIRQFQLLELTTR